MIALADLKDFTEEMVIDHLSSNYSGNQSGFDYGSPDESDKEVALEKLKGLSVLVAYEHVGDCGCDSSAFYILKNEQDEYFEIHAGHCSCYGFEGQLDLEKTTLKALQVRSKDNKLFFTGGYDYDSENHTKTVNDYILSL